MANELKDATDWAAEVRDYKPPLADVTLTDDNRLDVALGGNWETLLKAAGNTSVGNGIVAQVSILGAHGKRVDADATNFVLGFADAMKPRDAAELTLLTQMAATHQAVMLMARRFNHVETIPQQDAAEKALNKLARTFSAQMEALKRYRSKGQQVVRVERVTVEDGGQAVVGNIETGGRGTDEN